MTNLQLKMTIKANQHIIQKKSLILCSKKKLFKTNFNSELLYL